MAMVTLHSTRTVTKTLLVIQLSLSVSQAAYSHTQSPQPMPSSGISTSYSSSRPFPSFHAFCKMALDTSIFLLWNLPLYPHGTFPFSPRSIYHTVVGLNFLRMVPGWRCRFVVASLLRIHRVWLLQLGGREDLCLYISYYLNLIQVY